VVIVSAKFAGFVPVFGAGGGGEHENREQSELPLLANPFEDFETGFSGHHDVQQDQGGEGMAFAVGKGALAGEVIDGLLAIRHDTECVG